MKISYIVFRMTYPTAIKINADIAANPSPWLETKAISTKSFFLLKYWPTIKVAGFLVIATPKPKKKSHVSGSLLYVFVK